MDAIIAHVLIVVFLATLVRSAFGFGEALVAVPLLALRIPVSVAVPLAVLVSVVVAGTVMLQDWRHVHHRSAAWLVAATMLGVPLGVWALAGVDSRVVKGILAAIIISFSGYSLLAQRPPVLRRERRRWLAGVGFLAGLLGGAYGMNGPPLVVYGSLRRWKARQFRATLQAYFLPASALSLAGYFAAGLMNGTVWHYFLLSLPGVVVALLLGRVINRRLDAGRAGGFLTYVHILLIAIGLVLVMQTVKG